MKKSSEIPRLEWKFLQTFGDKESLMKASDEDIISALEFDPTGKFLGIGDRAGRLILFEETQTKGQHFEFSYLSEVQSHVKEFDFLKSADVEEKINQMQWLKPQGKSLFIVTTNDKSIKFWKITEKPIKKPMKVNSKSGLKLPKMEIIENSHVPTLVSTFPSLHSYLINSISTAYNEEVILSSDDLRVYLWNLEKPSKAFEVVDLKPDNIDEVSEVITSCKFHPKQDNLFIYSTSKGVIKLCDLRKNGICSNSAQTYCESVDESSKNFFTDIVNSISDAIFSSNGLNIITRDFLSTKVWDVRMSKKPISSLVVFGPLKSKLCDLYENECIFDKFNISSSANSNYYSTGNFNGSFHIIDRNGDINLQFELNFKKKTVVNQIPKNYFESLGNSYDYKKKVLKTTFHPKKNCIAIAYLNSLFFYGA